MVEILVRTKISIFQTQAGAVANINKNLWSARAKAVSDLWTKMSIDVVLEENNAIILDISIAPDVLEVKLNTETYFLFSIWIKSLEERKLEGR